MARDTTAENGDEEDLDVVADRLEAALERIGKRLDAPGPAELPAELAARLDGLIERLRDALGHVQG